MLHNAMKIVERVLERRIREIVNIYSMQFGFMPGIETTDALFVVRRMQVGIRRKSCTHVLWILRRHLIKFRER